MGLLARKLRTSDKWFRVNEVVRHNPLLKASLNANGAIQAAFVANLGIVNTINTAMGLDGASQGVPADHAAMCFPITKNMWMGTLPLDTYVTVPGSDRKAPEHALNFATNSHLIRYNANRIIAAYKLDEDSYNKPADGNPGGEVGP